MKRRLLSIFCFFIVLAFFAYAQSPGIDSGASKYKDETYNNPSQNWITGRVISDTGQKSREGIEQNVAGGYIIELKEKPLTKKLKELDEIAAINEEKIASMMVINPLKYGYQIFATTSEKVPKKLAEHKKRIEAEREKAEKAILEELGKSELKNLATGNVVLTKVGSPITGRAVSENSEAINVLGEYEKVFNGVALDITSEEADRIKGLKEVKAVYQNMQVQALLMDSVPLIKADDAWLLDEDGNQCASTGKPCMTGKGITIGIIDTGVDYTHGDLGASERINYDFLTKASATLPVYNLPDTLQIDGNKVYFNSNGEIHSFDYNSSAVSKITQNSNYLYFSFFVYGNSLVSIVHDKTQGGLGIIETDLGTYAENVLIPTNNKEMEIFVQKTGNYLIFDMKINYTTGNYQIGALPIFGLYAYDFTTKTLHHIRNDDGLTHPYGAVSNGNLYYVMDPVTSIKVYDLKTKQHLKEINIGDYITILDSFGDEILINHFLSSFYEILNVKTSERFRIPNPSSVRKNISNISNRLSISSTVLITGNPDYLAQFNNEFVVFEDQRLRDKFSIYDRVNQKIVSFVNLTYSFNEIDLLENRVCFSSREGVYCLDYDPLKDYEIQATTYNSKVIDGYDFVNNDNDPMDDHGHGTHVAATAAGNGILKGVAPDASIVAYKVLDSFGSGSFANVIAAIERSVDPNQDKNYSDHLDVISLSLGGSGNPDDPPSKAIDNAVDVGVVAVVAAGNSGGENTIGSPGTARNAITVGATDKFDNLAWFSSKGPVIWGKDAIIKPDIVAPGVVICAAEWDNAWSDRKCLDNEHIAISGTSMATPHVSGVVALTKQAHPKWTPYQIKMALRSTTLKLSNLPITYQGYGRVDALKAVTLRNEPCIAKIDTNGEQNNVFDIIGTAACNNFNRYVVYYSSLKNPSEQIQLYASETQVNDGVVYKGFDPSKLNDGMYVIKLEVYDSFGNKFEDNALVIIKNFELKGIGKTLNYIKGAEEVKGTIYLSDYSSYKVEYAKDVYSNGWTEICSSNQKPSNEVLCTIDVRNFDNGEYYFRIAANRSNNWVYSQPTKAIVLKELLDGWPVEINGFPRGWINIGNDRNSLKLVVPHYSYCTSSSSGSDLPNYNQGTNSRLIEGFSGISGNNKIMDANMVAYYEDGPNNKVYLSNSSLNGILISCGGSSLSIYNYDGSKKVIDFVAYDNAPTIYNDKEKNREYIALISEWGYKPGLIDFDGNYYFRWPEDNEHSGYPFVVSNLNDGSEDKLFTIQNDWWDTKTISIKGFDKTGKLLDNFPIKVEKGPGNESLVLRSARIIDSNGNKSIAIIAGSFNYNINYYVQDLVLFLDIYSLEGKLIKRTELFNGGSKPIYVIMPYFAVGDVNNDKNSEIVVGFSIIDLDLFFENMYNKDAYKTFYYILDSNGDIISKPYQISGYTINKLVLANLGEKNPNIVSALYDTWPTTYDGQKIVSFDNNGKIIFDINLENYNDIIDGLVAGDVDSDNEAEIIITHRPRWYGGVPSGIQIFSRNGVLEKRIEIPTLGQADDYWGFDPILSDFNGDGRLDLIQQSLFITNNYNTLNTRIYTFNLEGSYKKENLDWPMSQHDPQHTGIYGYQKPSSDLPPTVDLKANGLDGQVTIKSGDSAILTWTTTNYPKECVASNSWSGLKNPAGGSEATGSLFGPASFTYNLTCTNSAGSSSDSAIVNIIQSGNDLFNILKFDDNGNAVLKGALQQNSEPQPITGNAFIIIKDKSGNNVAVLDFTKGDIMIKGTLYQNQLTLAPPSNSGLILKDSKGNVISYIDDSGDFYLKGTLTYKQ